MRAWADEHPYQLIVTGALSLAAFGMVLHYVLVWTQ